MNIKGKKFTLIGGAGLIGSHTLEQILKEDIKEVIIYDNFSRGKIDNIIDSLKDSRVKIYESGGDILQTDILDKSIKNVDGVFHFAALWLLHCHKFPSSAFDVNIRGTFNVIESCRNNNIEKLVYSSSASVYGDAISEPMIEDHPFNNKNFYGATKIAGEAMLTAYHYRYNLNFVALRYMNVYGPKQDYKGAYIAVIMKMLDDIDQGKGPTILGDGSESFDFISAKDCGIANVCAMQAEAINDFYNVGTGIKTSLKKLAEILIKLTQSAQTINFIDKKDSNLVKNRVASIKKALKDLDFHYTISLVDGLRELINWRNNCKKKY